MRRFLSGESWIGLLYENLYDWLDRLDPTYTCVCGKRGDARYQDSSILLRVISYDPDLSPRTWLRGVTKHHSGCAPSGIVWDAPADVPEGPAELAVVAMGVFHATFNLRVRAARAPSDGSSAVPLLMVVADLVEGDDIDGLSSWDVELGKAMEARGFRLRTAPQETPRLPVWTIRAEPHNAYEPRPWAAVRTTPVQPGVLTKHLYFGPAAALTAPWLEQARSAGEVELVVRTPGREAKAPMYAARVALDNRQWHPSPGSAYGAGENDADDADDAEPLIAEHVPPTEPGSAPLRLVKLQ
jgi:hypothetical protein